VPRILQPRPQFSHVFAALFFVIHPNHHKFSGSLLPCSTLLPLRRLEGLLVFIQWAWAYVTYQRGTRLITGEDSSRVRPAAGH
jgi:hypothetical protein